MLSFFVELEEVVEADLEMEEYLWIYYRIFFFILFVCMSRYAIFLQDRRILKIKSHSPFGNCLTHLNVIAHSCLKQYTSIF